MAASKKKKKKKAAADAAHRFTWQPGDVEFTDNAGGKSGVATINKDCGCLRGGKCGCVGVCNCGSVCMCPRLRMHKSVIFCADISVLHHLR